MKFLIASLMIISSLQMQANADNIYEIQDIFGESTHYIRVKKIDTEEKKELMEIIFNSESPLEEKERALRELITFGEIEFEVIL